MSTPTTPQCTTQHIPAMTHCAHDLVRPAHTTGKVDGRVLLDLAASCSAISKQHVHIDQLSPGQRTKLVNVDGRTFQSLGTSISLRTL